jgi:hypothetical protein
MGLKSVHLNSSTQHISIGIELEDNILIYYFNLKPVRNSVCSNNVPLQ